MATDYIFTIFVTTQLFRLKAITAALLAVGKKQSLQTRQAQKNSHLEAKGN